MFGILGPESRIGPYQGTVTARGIDPRYVEVFLNTHWLRVRPPVSWINAMFLTPAFGLHQRLMLRALGP